jgi:predicted transcriptional regulator
MEGAIEILIDQETYQKFSKIAGMKQSSVVNEISRALQSYIDLEEDRLKSVKEGKQYLCEG